MATYIIIKNILEGAVKNDKIKKIELTKKGSGMFMEIHALVRKEYDNGFFMRSVTPETIADRKKRKMATVTIFKNGARMLIGFEYTLQNKKIDFTNVEVAEINDYSCPHCGNGEIEFDGDRTFGSNEASQEVYCAVCDCHWHNVYKFKEVQIMS
jgi:Zn finger protein HypA/HybF involved in hydrogenase expression